MNRQGYIALFLAVVCMLFSATGHSDQEAGETVLKRGVLSEDVYVAGGRVDVLAEVNGDVLAAGWRVAIDSQVTGDVLAAGGSITLHGRVDDDVRLAGGEVIISAGIGDAAIAAGGSVLLAPNASVGGEAVLSGGQVTLAGQVHGDVHIAGGRLMISGRVDGDMELAGKSIEIGPDVVILGKLTYRSPEPAEIHNEAHIKGEITYIPTPLPGAVEIGRGIAVVGMFLWLSLGLTGVTLYLLFAREALIITGTISTDPWKSLGLGLAMFAATPVLAIMLLFTGVGWLLSWLLMTVYCLLLCLGFLVSLLFLGNASLRRIRHGQEPSRLANSLAIMVTLLVIMIVGLIPLIGWLLVFTAVLTGIGGITLWSYKVHYAAAE